MIPNYKYNRDEDRHELTMTDNTEELNIIVKQHREERIKVLKDELDKLQHQKLREENSGSTIFSYNGPPTEAIL